MARRPSIMTYDDLSGDEVAHILQTRFAELLAEHPQLKPHLTLPRVKMELTVKLTCYAEQNGGDQPITITDEVELTTSKPYEPIDLGTVELSAVVDSSPLGARPDQVREEHGIPLTKPVRHMDAIGRSLGIANERQPLDNATFVDPREAVEGQRIQVMGAAGPKGGGVVVDRTGSHNLMSGATVVELDQGIAGLRKGQFNRGDIPGVISHRADVAFRNPGEGDFRTAGEFERLRNSTSKPDKK